VNIIPTPDMMWEAHRAALDGRSSVTGTPLPERLGDCPPLARGAHYAMALVAVLCVDGDPASVPVPPGITPEKAHFLRCKVLELLEPHRLRAAVDTLKRIVVRAEMLAEMPVAELLQLIYAARRHVQQATKMPENVADAPSEAVAPCQDAALVVIRALSEKP